MFANRLINLIIKYKSKIFAYKRANLTLNYNSIRYKGLLSDEYNGLSAGIITWKGTQSQDGLTDEQVDNNIDARIRAIKYRVESMDAPQKILVTRMK